VGCSIRSYHSLHDLAIAFNGNLNGKVDDGVEEMGRADLVLLCEGPHLVEEVIVTSVDRQLPD
jgi:hypothetical protein